MDLPFKHVHIIGLEILEVIHHLSCGRGSDREFIQNNYFVCSSFICDAIIIKFDCFSINQLITTLAPVAHSCFQSLWASHKLILLAWHCYVQYCWQNMLLFSGQ